MATGTDSAQPSADGVQAGPANAGGAHAGPRVLIVDDDAAGLEMLAVALLDSGFTVRTAANATEALAEARRVPPTLILADVVMPEMDGFQLCATLKQDSQLGSIPVVLMSSVGGNPRDQERSAEVGAAGYLTKPIDLPVLVDVLRQLAP